MYKTYVPAKGNRYAKIAIVGEAPSYEEVRELQPFVGPSGRFLDAMLRSAGISRNECWVTNACKYQVPSNPKEGKKIPFKQRAASVGIDIEKQEEELMNELTTIKPNIIIALGGTALFHTAKKHPITKWRGSITSSWGIKTIGTYHPAHILHQEGDVKGYWNKQVMLFDLKRAKDQSEFPEINLPKRNLQIIRNSGQLHDFIQRYKEACNPAIDIEAHNCVPICVGISFIPGHGVCIPLWEHTGITFQKDVPTIWKMLDDLLSRSDVVGQNFGYDRDKLRRLGFTVKSLKSDTMLKSFVINPELPKNLAFNTSLYTLEQYYKDEGMYEGSLNDLLIGCARDSCVTKEIDLKMDEFIDKMDLRDYYEQFILPLHEMYHYNENLDAIEQVGFRVDNELRKDLIRKYVEQDEKIRHDLFLLSGEYVNSNSPVQVSRLIYDKFKIPRRKGTGEEVLTGLLNNVVKNDVQKKVLELILEDRRVKKTLSSYLYSPSDFDGRMRTSYFLCLETGRSATQKQEPPIRPSVVYDGYEEGKKVKKRTARGLAFQTITKHGDIGSDIRRMLVPDKGCIFLQADSTQAEARVIFLLAEDYQALKDIDEHDYHALTASWFFGGTESDYSKKVLGYESPIRFAGKTLRHACHLGASKRTAAITVNTEARKSKIAYSISEKEAERAIKIFHEKQPKIRGVFQNEVKRIIETTRRLSAPVPFGIDSKAGGIRTFFERAGDELFRQAFSYIPQRTVSENTKQAGQRIRRMAPRSAKAKIIVESHDALLIQCVIEAQQEIAGIMKQEFERPIDFSACSLQRGELIIPCEVEVGDNYKDLSKFKHMELTNVIKQ